MTQGGKQKITGLWKRTGRLHGKIFKGLASADANGLVELLTECQSIAIDVGNYIDSYASKDGEALVHVLEAYCEQVYQVSVSLAKLSCGRADALIKALADDAQTVDEGLRGLKTRTEIVFFPYKMSMWDALESIWREASADEACDVYVVPIPYCDRNSDGTLKEWHYEGGAFPADVPVTDYGKYSLAEHLPDVAYIHNPYDGYNVVTSVAPDYYSAALKKYVKKLVYVPYYYAGGVLSDHQNSLPPLSNVDYIVLPGEAAVDAMAVYQPREKLLPLGSPKIDRMLLMDGHGAVPQEWKRLAQGRRIILYNVGLSPMLQGRYRSMEKMRQVFNVFKERSDVLVWWRPHPLIKATLHTAAPELLGAYEELEKEFVLEGIGIYDTGPDSNLAVASTDAFIGDYSSMIYMFGVTGKPIFYLNQRVLTDRAAHARIVQMWDFTVDEEKNLRFVSEAHGLACRFCMRTGKIEVTGPAPAGSVVWQECSTYQEDAFTWSAAQDGTGVLRRRADTGRCETYHDFPKGFYPFLSAFTGCCSIFSFLVSMGEWLYLFPGTANMVLKLHKESGRLLQCDWKLPYMEGQRKGTAFTWPSNYVCAKKYDEHTIVAVTAYDYSILVIDICTDEVKRYESCLSPEDIKEWVQTPVERVRRTGGIVYEDGLSCCLGDFLDDLADGQQWPREQQISAFAGEVNHADGTCGKRVHACIMEALKEDRNAGV